MAKDLDYTDLKSYLVSISKRIASLEVDTEEIKDHVLEKDNEIISAEKKFKDEMERLGLNLYNIKKEVNTISSLVDEVLRRFNTVARKNSMERLTMKIEKWSPEELATHKDLRREITKLQAKKKRTE